jgi:formylglycine-generating enzyme required for sulfatase activity
VAGGAIRPTWRQEGEHFLPLEGTEDEPVTDISFLDAQAYAKWAGKRLPTPPEWELAARGVDGRDYPFGMQLDTAACNAATGTIAKVGAFPLDRSPYGAYDMAGTVAEWTGDAGAEHTIVKGGSFELPRIHAMPTNFDRRKAIDTWLDVGFRCARSATR